MDLQSEYYNNLEQNMEKYDIKEESVPVAGEMFQNMEEMMFSFAMFMLM
ncbi:MAG: hypothetical protein RR310_07840 [Eubacterium sp.]